MNEVNMQAFCFCVIVLWTGWGLVLPLPERLEHGKVL